MNTADRTMLSFLRALVLALLMGVVPFFCIHAYAQIQPAEPAVGTIHGIVKAGNMPIPGAAVTITYKSSPDGSVTPTPSTPGASTPGAVPANPANPSAAATSPASQSSGTAASAAPAADTSATKISTWTDVDGSYSVAVPAYGSYSVRVEMVAFANSMHDVVIDASHQNQQVNFEMTLLSRTQEANPQPRRQVAQGQGTQGGSQRGFQMLSAMQNMAGQDAGANSLSDVVPSGMPVPGIDPNSATESIAVSGNTSNPFNSMSGDELQQRINDARTMGGGFGGGPGGFGGPGGGFGGGGPGGAMRIVGRRGFDLNHPHGSIYYGIGDSALNAAPYALNGQVTNPSYQQNSFGGSVGGPLNIPKIYQGGTKTFFFVNYNGRRGENPFDQFSTVPTLAERQGNFSALCLTGFNSAGMCNDVNSSGQTIDQIYSVNPVTSVSTPYAGNVIPGFAAQTCPWTASSGPANSIAAGLLEYIPCPNLPGDTQNFHYVTSTTSDLDDLNIRVNHTIGAAPTGGRRGGGGRRPGNSLAFGFHYHATNSNITNPFPSVGGTTGVRSFDVPIGWVKSIGKLTNSLRFDFNRSRTKTQNLYAFKDDIDSGLGITGVSTNPFDWGLPNLSFGDLTSLSDTNPQLLRNQTYTFSDYVVWTRGKHTWRWGGDFRRVQLNTEASSNARGAFTFSGGNTSDIVNGTQVMGTGYDFADFLLELPQSTAVEFGQDNYHFHGNYWDMYVQDEWKMRGNLTLNMGVRYEYVSPLTEASNLIANLDLSPLVFDGSVSSLPTSAVSVVTPGQTGPYNGSFPASLVRPDRKGFAPRVGFAWKPFSKTVVRGGYGINYNTGAYQTIAQQLAFQPPFSTAETNIQTVPGELTLANGFPTPAPGSITNSYAVNPNYRFGYVQIRNLDIQQQIRPTLLLNIDYTGTKGTNLDILEAPNRTISSEKISTRIGGVQAFTYENSIGDSEANAGSIRLRKRLASGFSIGGMYTFSKSIDDASSIGAGATTTASSPGLGAGGTGAMGGGAAGATASPGSGANTVAQNPFDISAERGLSSFNQTQKFTADYLWELPFGHDKHWLTDNTPARAIFGDWQWSGDWTIGSGLPFTPNLANTACEVSGGTSDTLRPDVVPGESVKLSHPSIGEWFNTAAFASPGVCAYGNARRNSIIGPGSKVFDMALTKVIPMQESRTLELRAQATNVFNIPNYSSINTTLNSPTYGRVTAVGAMRQITFTARFRF
jgi:trimeric autotransporter adhesin